MIYRVEHTNGLGGYRPTEKYPKGICRQLCTGWHDTVSYRPCLTDHEQFVAETAKLLYGFESMAQLLHWFPGIRERLEVDNDYLDEWQIVVINSPVEMQPDDFQVLFCEEAILSERVVWEDELYKALDKYKDLMLQRQEDPKLNLLTEMYCV